jgi:hypothetical protein
MKIKKKVILLALLVAVMDGVVGYCLGIFSKEIHSTPIRVLLYTCWLVICLLIGLRMGVLLLARMNKYDS